MQPLDIQSLVGRVFPDGTSNFGSAPPADGASWPAVPDFPPDLFAVAAYLLETAGAYHYFVPRDEPANWDPQKPAFIDGGEHAQWLVAGEQWSQQANVPPVVVALWDELGRAKAKPVFKEHRPNAVPERWWTVALGLAVVADEACADLGYGRSQQFPSAAGGGQSWIFNAWFAPLADAYDRLVKSAAQRGANHITYFPQSSSVCQKADPDVVCVQPKSRTPSLGCTLRTLSHNLALLPPRGVVRACWQRPPEALAPDDASSMNLLLIPYPFQVSATLFRPDLRLGPGDVKDELAGSKPWGWFEVEQRWLHGSSDLSEDERQAERVKRRQAIISFISRLVRSAMDDVGQLHGVVLPEYALDWETYEALADHLATTFPGIEFLVSGSSSNCKAEQANTALSSVFVRGGRTSATAADYTISTSRPKHHRWRLDDQQVSTYALASALDPRVIWWEKTLLPKRDIHVNVFREASTFATMICEDLARVDPCHAVLRSVAPSLVFVLLMDGPQLPTRWPARYATVLADDPGSSVLTLTSLALIERANRTGRPDGSRAIALWKEDTGRTESIPCPQGCHGVVLTLSGCLTNEITLDGRVNRDGRAWRFNGQQPVRYVPKDDAEKVILEIVTGTS